MQPYGDSGGELDPHGAENVGNPIGGNVTSNVPTGGDVFYEEWMSFVSFSHTLSSSIGADGQISFDQFCLRICTAETANVTTALQCEHELDVMGCQFVMAIPDFYQSNNSFTSCEGEAAPPPGLYPQPDGSTSTFRQRYTGTYTAPDGQTEIWKVGQTITPSAPAFYPATSNCVTYSTISNGVNTANYMVTAAPVLLVGSDGSSTANVGSTSVSMQSVSAGSGSGSASSARVTGSAASAASGVNDAIASGPSSIRSAVSGAAAGASSAAPSSGANKALGSSPLMLAAAIGGVGAFIGAVVVL